MKYPIIVLVTALLFGCSDGRIKPTKEDISEFRTILETAIAEQDKSKKAESIQPQEAQHITEARRIYDVFWNPKNLEQYGEMERDLDLYAKEYLIAQTELSVAIRTIADWPTNAYSAVNTYDCFNPRNLKEGEWTFNQISNIFTQVSFSDSQVLHLTSKLEEQLEDYLGSDFSEFGTPSIMTPAQAKGRSAQRLVAADTLLTIVPDHWGDGWHFISHPEISQILFNKDLNEAIVAFRIGYEGGYADLKKENDSWKIITSFMWWVE